MSLTAEVGNSHIYIDAKGNCFTNITICCPDDLILRNLYGNACTHSIIARNKTLLDHQALV